MVRLELDVPKLSGRQKAEFDRWLAMKAGGIGGSSAPAAIGISPWQSRLELWGEMTGRLVRDEVWRAEEEERLRWGILDEDGLLREAARRLGAQYVRPSNIGAVVKDHAEQLGIFGFKPGGQPLLRSRARPWQHHSIDGLCIRRDKGGRPCLLEGKTTSVWNAEDWEVDVPEHVFVQVQHGLAVTGLDLALVAVKIGGQELRVFEVEREVKVIEALNAQELSFMGYVERHERPPLETPATRKTLEALKRLYPEDSGATVDLPLEAVVVDRELQRLKSEAKTTGERIADLESKIRAWMGEATFGNLPGMAARWELKTTKVKGHTRTVEPYTYRKPVRKELAVE